MKNIIRLISLFLILTFTTACTSNKPDSYKTPWERWYFAFTTPKSLPAQVTLLKLLDIDGYACFR